MPYTEFKEYMCEDIATGQFKKYVDCEDNIKIEYKYGKYKDGKSTILFRIPREERWYTVTYSGSTYFAVWWYNLTDEAEGIKDDEAEGIKDEN